MRHFRLVLIVAIATIVLVWLGTSVLRKVVWTMLLPSQEILYPKAPPMPAAVPETVEDLLDRYERLLCEKTPSVLASLQPGLSDAQISSLESTHQFKLTPDLRALYRWRNGTPRASADVSAFPDHWFVPLDEAVAQRDAIRQQAKTRSAQQDVYNAVAGHRDGWLDVIVDLAGDGYFFDPGRAENQGSFFFCFAEDASYVFYPAFRNYLAAVLDGAEANVFNFSQRGVETADFNKAQVLDKRYGAANR